MGRDLVNLDKRDGDLRITLTDLGREELPDLIGRYGPDSDSVMHDLLEEALGNGWDYVPAEKIGALTGCGLIITDEVEWDEDREEILQLGRVYWHPNYMVESPAETLRDAGVFVLKGTSSADD